MAARHAAAVHRPAPTWAVQNAGSVSYEVDRNTDATCFGGIAAVYRLVVRLGLVDRIDDGLQLLKVHLPITSPIMC